jgi:hypothetical protein
MRDNGCLTRNDEEKAEVLNKFFSSVFTVEDMKNIPEINLAKNLCKELKDMFNENDVCKILCKIKLNKSPGPDMIHPNVLKEFATELAYPLNKLFRKSLDEGRLPQQWKDGHITAIFKKGSRCQVDNFRPISLTSVVCKLMERLARNALMKHLVENNQILNMDLYQVVHA